jgi:hypothetical protein
VPAPTPSPPHPPGLLLKMAGNLHPAKNKAPSLSMRRVASQYCTILNRAHKLLIPFLAKPDE